MDKPAHSEPQVKPQEKDDNAHLQAENARLREALEAFVIYHSGHNMDGVLRLIQQNARAALQTSGATNE